GTGENSRPPWSQAIFAVASDEEETGCVNRPLGLPRLLHAGCELLDEVVHRPVLANQARDLRRRVDHGRMVAAAELLADLRQGRVGELAREVHGDLARVDDVLRAAVA